MILTLTLSEIALVLNARKFPLVIRPARVTLLFNSNKFQFFHVFQKMLEPFMCNRIFQHLTKSEIQRETLQVT